MTEHSERTDRGEGTPAGPSKGYVRVPLAMNEDPNLTALDYAVGLAVMAVTGGGLKRKKVEVHTFEGRIASMVWPEGSKSRKNISRHFDALEAAGWFRFTRGKGKENAGRIIAVNIGDKASKHAGPGRAFTRVPKAMCWDHSLAPQAKRAYGALAYIQYVDVEDHDARFDAFLFSYNQVARRMAVANRRDAKKWVKVLYDARLIDFPAPSMVVEETWGKTGGVLLPLEIRYCQIVLERTEWYRKAGIHIYHPAPNVEERHRFWMTTGDLPEWVMPMEPMDGGGTRWLFPEVPNPHEHLLSEASKSSEEHPFGKDVVLK